MSHPPLRIGLAGVGTVGASVVRLLDQQADRLALRAGRPLRITAISARDCQKDRGFSLEKYQWVEDPVALAQSNQIDVFVELMGGQEGSALASVEAALVSGKSVVTANKALIARHGFRLAQLAQDHGQALAFEASVAGGIPILKTLREGLAGNVMDRVYGILNGTCNYILTQMESKELSFQECLVEAQRLGYAEADPSADIGGHDTAHKLAILTSLAFGTQMSLESVFVEGIEDVTLADIHYAKELGYRIKLLGVAQRTLHGIEQRVHPTMVPLSSTLGQTMGVMNAVTIDADAVHELTLVGPGAGGLATASAVLADLIDLARGTYSSPFGVSTSQLEPASYVPMQHHEGSYYIRFSVQNRVGAVAALAARMAEYQISLESIVQRAPPTMALQPDQEVPVVILTSVAAERPLRQALGAILKDGFVHRRPHVMRIERE